MIGDELYLAEPEQRVPINVVARPRIGVGYAGDGAEKQLRFLIWGNAFVTRR